MKVMVKASQCWQMLIRDGCIVSCHCFQRGRCKGGLPARRGVRVYSPGDSINPNNSGLIYPQNFSDFQEFPPHTSPLSCSSALSLYLINTTQCQVCCVFWPVNQVCCAMLDCWGGQE